MNTIQIYLVRPLTLLHILLARSLILSSEKAIRVLAEPLRKFSHLIAEFADGLVVHVRLGDEFGEGD